MRRVHHNEMPKTKQKAKNMVIPKYEVKYTWTTRVTLSFESALMTDSKESTYSENPDDTFEH